MSLEAPIRDNDYTAPSNLRLNKAIWDAVFNDIGARLRAREALEADFEELIDVGVSQALTLIAETVAPNLEAVNDAIAAANVSLEEFQVAFDQLVEGGVSASLVTETGTRVFVTPAQKTEIATLRSEMNAVKLDANSAYDTFKEISDYIATVVATVSTLSGSTTSALALKLNIADKASDAQVIAGTNDLLYVTPAKAKIAALNWSGSVGDLRQTIKSQPAGTWLKMDGAAYLQATYPLLYAELKRRYLNFIYSTATFPNTSARGIAVGSGYFVVFVNGTATVQRAPTTGTLTWANGGALSSSTQPDILAFVNNRFVALKIGSGTYVNESVDGGASWQTIPAVSGLPGSGSLGDSQDYGMQIAFGLSKYAIPGTSTNAMYTSPDLSTWTAVAAPVGWSGAPMDISFANGVFVVVGQDLKIAYGTTSLALVTIPAGLGLTATDDLTSIVYVTEFSRWIICGTNITGPKILIMGHDMIPRAPKASWPSARIVQVRVGWGGKIIAFEQTDYFWTSEDGGESWTKASATVNTIGAVGSMGSYAVSDEKIVAIENSSNTLAVYVPDITLATEFRVPLSDNPNLWINAA